MTDRQRTRFATRDEQLGVVRDAAITTLVLLVLMALLLEPAARDRPKVLGLHLSKDAVLLLLLAVSGGLGSMVHVFGSLLVRLRRGDLREGYLLWYRVRPMAGVPIAVVVFLAVRVGFVTGTPASLDTTDVLTAAAVGALAGMCFEQVSAKLKQVFEAIFTAPEGSDDTAPAEQKPPAADGGQETVPSGADDPNQTLVEDATELATEHPEPDSRITPEPPVEE